MRSFFTKRLFSVGPALCLLVSGGVARAEPARIEYSAPASCPSEAAFVERVRERGGSFDAPSAAGAVLAVTLQEKEGEFAGSVRLENGGASTAAREVRSPRCEEVADGLAVVAAIALSGKQEEQPAAEPASSAPAPAPASPAPPVPAPAPPPKPEPRKLRTVGQFGDASVAVGPGEVGVHNDSAITLSGGAALGLLPGVVVPRYDLSISRTNFITTPEGDGFIVGGILRIRWSVLGPSRYESGGERTDFFALKAGVGGCSQLSYDREAFIALFCGEIAAGAANLLTKSETGAKLQDETLGVGTAGFDLDTRYNLTSWLHVGLNLGGELWLGRPTARRADGSELMKTGFLAGYATLGLGVHF